MSAEKLLTAAILIAGIAPALYAGKFDDKVRNDFFAGFAGDRVALERAMKLSEESIAEKPDEAAEALAWHGSGLMVYAGEYFRKGDVATGLSYWDRAMAEMDKAGSLAPDNPAVLIPRAATWFAVSRQTPPERGRPLLERAIADYEHVYDLQKAYFDTLSTHMRSELLFGLADGYARAEKPEKAHLYFQKLAAIGSASGHMEQAKLYLNGDKYEVRGVGCAGCHTGK